METVRCILFFLLGTVFGSFFNVVIHRLPGGISIVSPPSACPACRKRIPAKDNIPLLSYMVLGGKCRNCGVPISIRYPLVELLGGFIFLLSYYFNGLTYLLARDVVFYSILLIVTCIDIDKRIIPDSLSIGGLVVGFLMGWLFLGKGWKFPLGGILAGSGILFLTAYCYELITKREGLGGGDIKLLGAIGAFTGYQGAILTIFLGSVIGTLYGAFLMVKEKGDMKTAVPFGPFLAVGALLADIFLRNYTIQF